MRKLRTEQRGQQAPSQDSEQWEVVRFDRRLLVGLDEDGVQELAIRFKSSQQVRDAIKGALTKEIDSAILCSESREVLNSPNALASLADLHGYRRGLRLAVKLLTNQETNDQLSSQ